jgi:branched-chain amino acid transport system permease protein
MLPRELVASLLILGLMAVLSLLISNEYWRGVLIVALYFAMLAAACGRIDRQFSLAPTAFGMIGAYLTRLMAYDFATPRLIGSVRDPGRWDDRARAWTDRVAAAQTVFGASRCRLPRSCGWVISNSMAITRGDVGLNVRCLPGGLPPII